MSSRLQMSSVSLDDRVHLRLVQPGEVALAAPLRREVKAGVERARRVHAEGVEAIAVERQREVVRQLDGHGRLVEAAVRALDAERHEHMGVGTAAVKKHERSVPTTGRLPPLLDKTRRAASRSRDT